MVKSVWLYIVFSLFSRSLQLRVSVTVIFRFKIIILSGVLMVVNMLTKLSKLKNDLKWAFNLEWLSIKAEHLFWCECEFLGLFVDAFSLSAAGSYLPNTKTHHSHNPFVYLTLILFFRISVGILKSFIFWKIKKIIKNNPLWSFFFLLICKHIVSSP